MSTITRILVAAGAAAALAPAAANAGQRPPTFPTRTFAVTVEGVQSTHSGYTHTSSGPCDPAATSTGYERVVFRSTSAKIIEATDLAPLVLFGHGRPAAHILDTTATVTRRSTYTHDPIDPSCQEAGGGGRAPSPDCGTRRVHLQLDLGWFNPKGIVVRTPDGNVPVSPFTSCPVDGVVFPYVLDTATHGRPIIARIPASDLFNRAWKEHILLGGGKFASWSKEGGYTTTIRWTVTLRAVRPR